MRRTCEKCQNAIDTKFDEAKRGSCRVSVIKWLVVKIANDLFFILFALTMMFAVWKLWI